KTASSKGRCQSSKRVSDCSSQLSLKTHTSQGGALSVEQNNNLTGLEVAIIGMAGRFPQSRDLRQFWPNLADGLECISFFSDEELLASGLDLKDIQRPEYVRARGVIEDCEAFDAGFFKFTPREAEITDPQQRLFLECA